MSTKNYPSPVNPFLYGWLNDNFQKEFRTLLPFLFRVFSGDGGKRLGVVTTTPADATAVAEQQHTPRTETIRLHQLRSELNTCRNDEEKVLVEATLDNVHHQNDAADTDADD